MHNELNTVEDIDTLLDSQFKLTEEESSINNEETDGNVEDQEEDEIKDDEDQESESGDETKDDDENAKDEEKEEDSVKKPDDSDKKDFAFGKMRKENSELKTQLNEKKAESEFLSKLAAQYGYTDVKKFQEDYERARLQKEAKEKGLDPVLYEQLQASNKRIAELENKQKEADLMNRASNFKASLDKVIKDYGLEENVKDEVFNMLEEAGYSVDTLLSEPKPEILIKGVLSDKIAEISKQKQIDKQETLDNLTDEKHNGVEPSDNVTLDSIIANDIKQYKADNFFN